MSPLATLVVSLLLQSSTTAAQSIDHRFQVSTAGEGVATIAAGCAPCDWSTEGHEAVLLEISVDGVYSQHLALTRGGAVVEYPIVLGDLQPGEHRLTIARDSKRSAAAAGPVTFGPVQVRVYDRQSAEYTWVARAPILRARPGTVEKFSDFPLVMYAEQNVSGESGSRYSLQYTVIFTNEDGGTPTDRLMATWGRTTDIEFIYGLTEPATGSPPREEIQAEGHKWVEFRGPRVGTHPVLWVATLNNMVADHGADDLISFAPAPQLVSLDRTSRESVMDANPWMYAVTSAEMVREHRIDPGATPGSGRIVDPRRYATIEACGQVRDATLAFDIGVRGRAGEMRWFATDTDPRFRIARGGCFRGGAPLPEGTRLTDISGLRIRGYTRPARPGETAAPATGSVVLQEVTQIFMLDERFIPRHDRVSWKGSLDVQTDGTPVPIPIVRAREEPKQ
jgi:hypothetical protein